MNLKIKIAALLLLCGSCLYVQANEKYANPALNKVKFEQPVKHAPLQLVENGKLNFAIVADLKADKSGKAIPSGKPLAKKRWSVTMAVDTLQRAFLRTVGAKPVVLAPDSPKLKDFRYKIWVGKSAYTDRQGIQIEKLRKEGFAVKTTADGVMIVGHDGNLIPGFYHDLDLDVCNDNGSVNGVYDFMERFLGMRFYYPGLGTYVPKIKDLQIESVAYTDAPVFYTRNFGQISKGFIKKGQKKGRSDRLSAGYWPWDDIEDDSRDYLRAYRAIRNTRFICSESPHPFKMQQAFPDKIETMFARDKNGKLYYSTKVYTDNYFDISNPEFTKLMVGAFKKFYDTNGKWNPIWGWYHPTPEYMCFGAVDTHKVIDNDFTRKYARKNPGPNSVMSEINSQFYLRLATELKKVMPDKKLAVLAYANYLYPPDTIEKFPDNLRVMACVGTPAYIRHPGYADFFKWIYESWNRKLSGKVIPYLYDPSYAPQGGLCYTLRGYFEGELLHKMKDYLDAENIFPCVSFKWDYYYSTYLIARAYWNPEFNADAALQEHWKLFFGEKSAKSLQKFYALVIDRWVNHYLPKLPVDKRCIPGLNYPLLYEKGFTIPVGKQMSALLKQAEADLPKNDKDARRRFLFFSMPWQKIINDIYAYNSMKVPSYQVKFGTAKVDGDLNDPIWKKAKVLPMRDAFYGKSTTGVYPEIRLSWNKQGIFVAVKAKAPYVKKTTLWGEDNVEFFLTTEGIKDKLFQFVLSSGGRSEDYFQSYNPPRGLDQAWTCAGWQKAVKSDAKGWTAEMFIPFRSMDEAKSPIPGDSWYGNFISNKVGQPTMSLAPTMGSNRNISTYSKLYFCGNCE